EPVSREAEIVIRFDGYNGAEDTIVEFIPIDDLSSAIRRDGKITFTVKKADVNEMLDRIKK
ncbi:MAG: hypothetical protein J1F64_08725, partial [Oscillospiraceae bacterium]|nr:hypothetical protein [Oscillospiraceae bacterium]